MSVFPSSLAHAADDHRSVRRGEQHLLTGVLLATDTLVVLVSFALAYTVRFRIGSLLFEEGSIRPAFYASVICALVPGYLLLYHIYGLYSRSNLLGGTTEYARVFNAVTAGLLLVIVISFVQPAFVIARGWLLLSWALMITLGIAGRFVVRRLVYWQRARSRFLDRTLIVGAGAEGLAVAEQLMEAPSSGALIVGFVDDDAAPGAQPLPGVPVLGGLAALSSLVGGLEVDAIVVAGGALSRERLLAIYAAAETRRDVEVRMASGWFDLLTTGMHVREEGYVPLVVLHKTRITGVHYALKTLLDYCLAALGLLALLPAFAAIALLIRRESPGPALYRRRVVGQGRREFDAFKFRTMRLDGDSLLTPAQRRELEEYGKLKDDPRVTRVGALLRRYSLDELPQLLNVLRGEMSLIGPRMITMQELVRFGKWQYNLATVKPGLTGLWQVSGRSDLSYEDRVRLDMHYIRNHSIWLDLHILFRTIPALLSGRGAY